MSLSPLLFMLALLTFRSRPVLATLLSWFQTHYTWHAHRNCAVLLMSKSDASLYPPVHDCWTWSSKNSSVLDYCNSLLSGFSLYLLSRVQKVRNSAAKLVFKARKRDHVQSFLQALHWLLAQARIHYKLSTVSTFSPKLTHLLPISLTFSLCTPLPGNFVLLQTHGYFVSPMTEQKTSGQRCFSYCAPKQ